MKSLYQVRCSERKQRRNLNINSVAPEISINFYKMSEAKRYKKAQKLLYSKCNIKVIK